MSSSRRRARPTSGSGSGESARDRRALAPARGGSPSPRTRCRPRKASCRRRERARRSRCATRRPCSPSRRLPSTTCARPRARQALARTGTSLRGRSAMSGRSRRSPPVSTTMVSPPAQGARWHRRATGRSTRTRSHLVGREVVRRHVVPRNAHHPGNSFEDAGVQIRASRAPGWNVVARGVTSRRARVRRAVGHGGDARELTPRCDRHRRATRARPDAAPRHLFDRLGRARVPSRRKTGFGGARQPACHRRRIQEPARWLTPPPGRAPAERCSCHGPDNAASPSARLAQDLKGDDDVSERLAVELRPTPPPPRAAAAGASHEDVVLRRGSSRAPRRSSGSRVATLTRTPSASGPPP